MTTSEYLESITYSHYYNHQMKMSLMVSRIIVSSAANAELFQTLANRCTNAEIVQK